ncbi:GDP-fucose protein O-fucosyltransferase [Cinnamomum micranthum f. kanehirae]|uniref:O-fucosyltransferase family protein n=1 Tax=Cinnamomum micranthum f. kanehirae TaxID=337451 RepID=A0A3S3NBV8_9MAGN|nr:GDP-fucose protein O-fucosyltransferase [Cinnamomum micranthum f. kanehirae]
MNPSPSKQSLFRSSNLINRMKKKKKTECNTAERRLRELPHAKGCSGSGSFTRGHFRHFASPSTIHVECCRLVVLYSLSVQIHGLAAATPLRPPLSLPFSIPFSPRHHRRRRPPLSPPPPLLFRSLSSPLSPRKRRSGDPNQRYGRTPDPSAFQLEEETQGMIFGDPVLRSSTTDAVIPARHLHLLKISRSGIDSVVVARILNASLVVPKLDQNSFWKDNSTFTEIFDVDWFISFLSKDVKIVKEVPRKDGKIVTAPYRMRVPRKCTPRCYEKRVLPVLLKKHVVQLGKFDYRLANKLNTDLQKLRCRVNLSCLEIHGSYS